MINTYSGWCRSCKRRVSAGHGDIRLIANPTGRARWEIDCRGRGRRENPASVAQPSRQGAIRGAVMAINDETGRAGLSDGGPSTDYRGTWLDDDGKERNAAIADRAAAIAARNRAQGIAVDPAAQDNRERIGGLPTGRADFGFSPSPGRPNDADVSHITERASRLDLN